MQDVSIRGIKAEVAMLHVIQASRQQAGSTQSTSDSAACTITSDFCPNVPLRPVERPAPRKASAGFGAGGHPCGRNSEQDAG